MHLETRATRITISGELIAHVHTLYGLALREVVDENQLKGGINGFTSYAFGAFITAVASVEAFVNETMLGSEGRRRGKWAVLDAMRRERLDRLELLDKLLLLPQLVFGRTFDRGRQPFQDFAMLVKIRNDIVHYKMPATAPGYLKDLLAHGIALAPYEGDTLGLSTWPRELSTLEAIRWAVNTCHAVTFKIVEFAEAEEEEQAAFFPGGPWDVLKGNFRRIDESAVRKAVESATRDGNA